MDSIDRWVDIGLAVVAASGFTLMTLAMILPTRRPDGLSKALAALFTLYTIVAVIGVAQAFALLPLPLPDVARWVIRVAYIPCQAIVIVRLWRDGAFARGKDGHR